MNSTLVGRMTSAERRGLAVNFDVVHAGVSHLQPESRPASESNFITRTGATNLQSYLSDADVRYGAGRIVYGRR